MNYTGRCAKNSASWIDSQPQNENDLGTTFEIGSKHDSQKRAVKTSLNTTFADPFLRQAKNSKSMFFYQPSFRGYASLVFL